MGGCENSDPQPLVECGGFFQPWLELQIWRCLKFTILDTGYSLQHPQTTCDTGKCLGVPTFYAALETS
jgi:hypothetical protein